MDESFSYRCTTVPEDDKVAHLMAEKACILVEDLRKYLKDLRTSKATDVNELMNQKTVEIGVQFVDYMNALIQKEGGENLNASRDIFFKYVTDTKKIRDSKAKVLSDRMKNAVKLKKEAQEAALEADMADIDSQVDEEATRIRREAEEKVENFKKKLLIKVEKKKMREAQEMQKMESDRDEKIRNIDQEKLWVERLFESITNAVGSAANGPTM